jgi:hypothetical protein
MRKADEKTKPDNKKVFFKGYSLFLKLLKHLYYSNVHKRSVEDMTILHNKGDVKALSNVLVTYKRLFEGQFDKQDSEDKDDEYDDEDGEPDEGNGSDQVEIQVRQGLTMDIIMSAISKPYRYRGKAIMSHIMKDHRDILGWNERGELHYGGKTISGSHVIDLLKGSQQSYTNLVPLGIEKFYQGFREINIPQSLITNDQRRM